MWWPVEVIQLIQGSRWSSSMLLRLLVSMRSQLPTMHLESLSIARGTSMVTTLPSSSFRYGLSCDYACKRAARGMLTHATVLLLQAPFSFHVGEPVQLYATVLY